MVKIFQGVFPNVVEAQVNDFMAKHTGAKVVNSYTMGDNIVIVVEYSETTTTNKTTA